MAVFNPDWEVKDSKDFDTEEPPPPKDPSALSMALLIANDGAGEGFFKIVLGGTAHLELKVYCLRKGLATVPYFVPLWYCFVLNVFNTA